MEAKEMQPGRTYLLKFRRIKGKQGTNMFSKYLTFIKILGNQIYGYVLDNTGMAIDKTYYTIASIESIKEVRLTDEG